MAFVSATAAVYRSGAARRHSPSSTQSSPGKQCVERSRLRTRASEQPARRAAVEIVGHAVGPASHALRAALAFAADEALAERDAVRASEPLPSDEFSYLGFGAASVLRCA